MKKFSLLLLSICFSLAAMSQASIKFEKSEHDFGKIEENGGNATYTFTFTNNGDSTLYITNVKASCGCTTPSWTQTPIEPNSKGIIQVSYNPKGRPGAFGKSISVFSNATPQPLRLIIRGEVVDKVENKDFVEKAQEDKTSSAAFEQENDKGKKANKGNNKSKPATKEK
ncbi:DUF1573 domain-containing protein [Paludibacter sp. 221]|uniref:DUF1573 domain-containing protein n=1 Tax=Paludibacter sp. 221 TaxID=2302939 RepID=UPI0013D55877|nr:DUF1573 domain-containing protein [Paludibacter sp. 221]NDV45653.1 DUF1573 domain-containing protein [Paludibacter sp. 221]